MKRGETGSYEVTSIGGEQVRAFIPRPLPPAPPLALDGPLHQTLEQAVLALGRLDGVAAHLPFRAGAAAARIRASSGVLRTGSAARVPGTPPSCRRRTRRCRTA